MTRRTPHKPVRTKPRQNAARGVACLDHLVADGYALADSIFTHAQLSAVAEAIESLRAGVSRRRGEVYAARNLLRELPALRDAIRSPKFTRIVKEAFRVALGATTPFAVRAILFDKRAEANWHVGWHQDTAIAVAARFDTPGFGPWSVKQGVVHVRPPGSALARMLAARIHLDDCPAENGPLRVIPASHRQGMLAPDQVRRILAHEREHVVTACAGDVLVMSPLLLHASSPAAMPEHRRVIHVEFACEARPATLEWHEQISLD